MRNLVRDSRVAGTARGRWSLRIAEFARPSPSPAKRPWRDPPGERGHEGDTGLALENAQMTTEKKG